MKIIIKKQTGFTLIELMIAVAIIGVLAAIAIPQYQTYVIKAKLTEAIILSKPMKMQLEDYYYGKGIPLVKIGGPWDEGLCSGCIGTDIPRYPSQEWDQYWAHNKTDILKMGFISGGYVYHKLKSGGSGGLPASLDNKSIIMIPRYTDPVNLKGDLDWICGVIDIPFKYLPTHCHHIATDTGVRRPPNT